MLLRGDRRGDGLDGHGGPVVVGESVNFSGGLDWLRESGVNVVDLASSECIDLLAAYIRARPEIWNEDIGVSPGA